MSWIVSTRRKIFSKSSRRISVSSNIFCQIATVQFIIQYLLKNPSILIFNPQFATVTFDWRCKSTACTNEPYVPKSVPADFRGKKNGLKKEFDEYLNFVAMLYERRREMRTESQTETASIRMKHKLDDSSSSSVQMKKRRPSTKNFSSFDLKPNNLTPVALLFKYQAMCFFRVLYLLWQGCV